MKALFGIRLPVSGPLALPEAITKIAVEADHQGFDAVCVNDYLTCGRETRYHLSAGVAESVDEIDKKELPVTNFYEAMSTLSYVAGLTKNINLGPSAIALPWRHPVLFAKQCATIQELSNGRFVPALVIGGVPGSFEATGLPFNQRGQIFDESLELINTLWLSNRKVVFERKYFKVKADPIYPKPRPIPIWMGGSHSHRVYERVAKYGEGLLTREDLYRSLKTA